MVRVMSWEICLFFSPLSAFPFVVDLFFGRYFSGSNKNDYWLFQAYVLPIRDPREYVDWIAPEKALGMSLNWPNLDSMLVHELLPGWLGPLSNSFCIRCPVGARSWGQTPEPVGLKLTRRISPKDSEVKESTCPLQICRWQSQNFNRHLCEFKHQCEDMIYPFIQQIFKDFSKL